MNRPMTLGELIAQLEAIRPGQRTKRRVRGLGPSHGARVYYDHLAFDPAGDRTVQDLLDECDSRLAGTVDDYRGRTHRGQTRMPLWVAVWGDVGGLMLVSLDTSVDPAVPTLEVEPVPDQEEPPGSEYEP